MAVSTMNFKLDENLKAEFTQLAKDLGLTSTGLLTLFVKKAVDEQGVPFEVKRTQRKYHENFYKMLETDRQKIRGQIPDDAEPLTDKDFERWEALYK
ncbi:MAG: type II toxin-antitoxin system RelB/DinJ family antitoxin [Streptococcaceae bacterium]|jgi:DNA-damage-inducible protein J|nr:type II toxin-antitoxin system RelB/DinJ family antitoxin [Streptococcaceae bacterium]